MQIVTGIKAGKRKIAREEKKEKEKDEKWTHEEEPLPPGFSANKR